MADLGASAGQSISMTFLLLGVVLDRDKYRYLTPILTNPISLAKNTQLDLKPSVCFIAALGMVT